MLFDSFQFWGVHLVWWVISIAFLIGIFIVATSAKKSPEKEQRNPLDIITSQYASGEIDAAEYIRKKKFLQSNMVDKNFGNIINAE